MDIGTIAGIHLLPTPTPRPADLELTAIFDVEASARPGDDTYSTSGRKAAGAEEPEEEEAEDLYDDAQDAASGESRTIRFPVKINFFA